MRIARGLEIETKPRIELASLSGVQWAASPERGLLLICTREDASACRRVVL